jgi:anti-anti-sigma factor
LKKSVKQISHWQQEADRDAVAPLLQTHPGVGPITALALLSQPGVARCGDGDWHSSGLTACCKITASSVRHGKQVLNMPIALESRHCGSVYIVRCAGRIATGPGLVLLEDALKRGLREFPRLVLNVSAVDYVDSSGMGLIVRFLWHARTRGGDLRLAGPNAFVTKLLEMTKLSAVFHIYDDEESAIVSFLKEGTAMPAESANTGPRVLFLDPSPDTCAFVRAVLTRHGYRVLSTGLMGDAKILLTASTVDVIVLGPDSGMLSSSATLKVLQELAPSAKMVVLEKEFKSRAADEAGATLLDRMQPSPTT